MTTSDWLQYPELNCTVATVTETAETCVPTFTRVNSVQIATDIYYREIRNELVTQLTGSGVRGG